jgi:tellurite resistance protein
VQADDDPVVVVLGGGLLDDFSSAEVAFVLGHELAHVLYSHHLFPLHQQLHSYQVEKLISIKDKLHSGLWPRRTQVTADRIGLLCCQDLDAAVSALYKVYAGAPSEHVSMDPDTLLAEYDAFEEMIRKWSSVDDAYREIYPLSRVKCLKLFSESAMYAEVTGSGASRSDEDVTKEIEAVITAMEPKYLHDDAARQETKEHYILTAAFFMMTADGRISDDEVSALKTLVSSEVFDRHFPECEKFPRHELWRSKLYNRGQELEWFASVAEKHEIASNLVSLAYADGDLEERERNALYEICSSMQLSPYTTEELLSEKSVLG